MYGTNAWYLQTFSSLQNTQNIKFSTVITSCHIYLSGKFCRGDEMSMLVTTLYSMM